MQTAYVLINCELGKEEEKLDSLKHMESVKEVHGTFGANDIICKIETSDYKTLDHVITKAIRSLPRIKTSMTLNIINEQES